MIFFSQKKYPEPFVQLLVDFTLINVVIFAFNALIFSFYDIKKVTLGSLGLFGSSD